MRNSQPLHWHESHYTFVHPVRKEHAKNEEDISGAVFDYINRLFGSIRKQGHLYLALDVYLGPVHVLENCREMFSFIFGSWLIFWASTWT